MAKNLAIHVLLTYIIQIKFAKYRLSTLGRGLREMAHICISLAGLEMSCTQNASMCKGR